MLHSPAETFEINASACEDSFEPNTGVWTVEIVDQLSALHDRVKDWEALERNAADPHSAFQSTSWAMPWLEHIGVTVGVTPVVAFVFRDRGLAAILPLMQQRRAGVIHLLPLGEPHSQICDALTKAASDCTVGLALALAEVTMRPGVDVVALGPMLEGSALYRAASVLVDQRRRRDHAPVLVPDPAGHITLIDGTAGAFSVSKSRRKSLRRGMERLSALGDVTLCRVDPDHPDFATSVIEALQHKRRWLDRKGLYSTGLSHKGMDAFLTGLVSDQGAFKPEVEILTAGNQSIAFHINLVGPNPLGKSTGVPTQSVRQCYLSTYDPAHAAASPGNLLIHLSLTTSDERGTTCLSLLGHPTPQKASWETERIGLARFEQALSRKGGLWMDGWINGLRPLLKRAVIAARKPAAPLLRLAKSSAPRKG